MSITNKVILYNYCESILIFDGGFFLNQQFILGIMVGTFVSIEIYLLYETTKIIFKGKIINSLGNFKKSLPTSFIIEVFTVGVFTAFYLYLINIEPPKNTAEFAKVKNFIIYKDYKTSLNIALTVVFIFEIVTAHHLSKSMKIRQGTKHPEITKAFTFFILTFLFLSYNFILLFSDFKDPSSFSGIALGTISILFTLLIAILTFKNDE